MSLRGSLSKVKSSPRVVYLPPCLPLLPPAAFARVPQLFGGTCRFTVPDSSGQRRAPSSVAGCHRMRIPVAGISCGLAPACEGVLTVRRSRDFARKRSADFNFVIPDTQLTATMRRGASHVCSGVFQQLLRWHSSPASQSSLNGSNYGLLP